MKKTILFILSFMALHGMAQNTEKHFKNLKQLTYGGDNAEA